MIRQPLRRLAAVLSLVLAATATIATSPAAFDASADVQFRASLTLDHPIDVHRVRIKLVKGVADIGRTLLKVGPDWEQTGTFPPGFLLAILPEAADEAVVTPVPRLAEDLGNLSHDLTETCRLGCERSYLIVVQGAIPMVRAADVRVSVDSYVEETPSGGGPRPTASISHEEVAVADPVAVLQATAEGRFEVTGSSAVASWRGTVRVSQAALSAGRNMVLGGVWVEGASRGQGVNAGSSLWVTVNGDRRFGQSFYPDRSQMDPVSRDWLSSCVPGTDCVVPLQVELEWGPNTFSLFPIEGEMSMDYTIHARLEYLDLTEVPAGATLELVAEQ